MCTITNWNAIGNVGNKDSFSQNKVFVMTVITKGIRVVRLFVHKDSSHKLKISLYIYSVTLTTVFIELFPRYIIIQRFQPLPVVDFKIWKTVKRTHTRAHTYLYLGDGLKFTPVYAIWGEKIYVKENSLWKLQKWIEILVLFYSNKICNLHIYNHGKINSQSC